MREGFAERPLTPLAAARPGHRPGVRATPRVVWNVDPLAETITAYRSDVPAQSTRFAKGQVAEAEPALPGWWVPVDELFP